jgi:ElaA protein
MIKFKWYQFSELSTELLYSVLALRADVFIVEQKRVCLDPDGKDTHALHLLGIENGVLVAYIRVFPPTDIENHITFGRALTAKFVRIKGYGKRLIQELLDYCATHFPRISIVCCAQQYLKRFYENVGFKPYGDIYEVDGIPHISMKKESS